MTQHNLASPFEVGSELQEWQVTAATWLEDNNRELEERSRRIDGVCSGNVVFNNHGKVLLIQRAAHDSSPNRWEIPGGAVDDDDETILHGAARELYEEAGLTAKKFDRLVPGPDGSKGVGALDIFPNRTGVKWFGRFVFTVEVEDCDNVKLDPNEHQDYIWLSKHEVQEEGTAGRAIPITHPAMKSAILRAFELGK